MNYEESSNVISITGALPTTDETGKVRLNEGEYFDFSVSTNLNGEAVINWEIAAEDFEDNTFDGSNVKFYLTKLDGDTEVPVSEVLPRVYSEETEGNDKTGRPAEMMSLLVGSTQTQGEEVTNYRLRLYVDEAYNPQGDGGNLVFKTRVNVYGKVDAEQEKTLPMLMEYSEGLVFFNDSYRKGKVGEIVVKTDTIIPETAAEVTNGKGNYWDVSEKQDGSVIAYIEEKGIESDRYNNKFTSYKLTIGGNGGVAFPSNATWLFSNFTRVRSIDLTNVDTSNVISMELMFYGCINLRNINLITFNTSKVTSMKKMFYQCSYLKKINLSSFDTSNVTDMSYMFSGAYNLEIIRVSNKWTIETATSTTEMFKRCKTSKVTVV